MTEQAFIAENVESQSAQVGESNVGHLNSERDSLDRNAQLQMARELHQGSPLTDSASSGQEEKAPWDQLIDIWNNVSPEQRAYAIEENINEGLEGDEESMKEAKVSLQKELGRADGDETFKQIEKDGRYVIGRSGAPHAKIEYAKDADGNDTEEVVAIEFSHIELGLPPSKNSTRIELDNRRADLVREEADREKEEREIETFGKALDGQMGSKAAEQAWMDLAAGKAPDQ